MAQESFSINSHFLKHVREKSGLTIEKIADICDLSTRQYQRIEANGKTTRKTAFELAKKIGISVEELQGIQPIDKSPWYVKNRDDFYGRLTIGYHDVINELFREVNVGGGALNNNGCVLFEVNDKQLPITLKVTLHPNTDEAYTSEWLIRPAIINESGILWAPLNQWQELDWKRQVDNLAYNLANKVIINDELLVPESSKIGFFVCFDSFVEDEKLEERSKEEKKLPNGEWVVEGTQFFQKDADFRCSLTEWLEENRPLYPFPVHPSLCPPGVLVMLFDGSNHRLIITRAWLGESGKAQKAPWPEPQREQLAEALEVWFTKPAPLPIAIGEFGSENFPALVPERETEHQVISKS